MALPFVIVMAMLMSMGSITVANAQAAASKLRTDTLTLVTASGSHPVKIEVAETQDQQALGLMFRPVVPPDTGMLFPYDRPRELTMWMHNTYASLDMVFIRPDGIVHRIEHNAEPLSDRVISSQGPVSAVLELAAGEAERLGLKPGDSVQYALFKPKR